MPVMLYLLFGQNDAYRRQLIFSITTALRWLDKKSEELRIAVISDHPDPAPGLPVDHLRLRSEDIYEWSDAGRFNLRVKPMALRHALIHYGTPVILIDTDTRFIASPARLLERVAPGKSLMHCREYPIHANASLQPLVDEVGDGVDVGGYQITRETLMWNSGVVGLHPDDLGHTEKIVRLTDRLRAMAPHFTNEQLATSIVLQASSDVAVCGDTIDHYWDYRRPFCNLQIDRFLSQHPISQLDATVRAASTLAVGFPRKTMRDRAWARAQAKMGGWNGALQYAYLLYRTSLYYGRRDPEVGTLWARTTLWISSEIIHSLESNAALRQTELRRIESIMHQFSAEHIDRLAWLPPELRAAWHDFWSRGQRFHLAF